MRCESCGANLPDPKPVVIEKIKEVYVGENVVFLRIALYLVVIILCTLAGCELEIYNKQKSIQKALDTPGAKVELNEYDSVGKPTLKVTK